MQRRKALSPRVYQVLEFVMSFIYPFPSQLPKQSHELPATLMSLEEWALVNVNGQDCKQYLQGQFTCDVNELTPSTWTYTAHCDAKGKVFSVCCLFTNKDAGLAYLQRNSACNRQLNELKKYAVFSKVVISRDNDSILLGLAGHNCRTILQQHYNELPDADNPVVHLSEGTLLHFSQPHERFIIIVSRDEAQRLYHSLHNFVDINDSKQWQALDMEAGIPIIDAPCSEMFIPQSINLQALEAISFKKGCYVGQETIARARYRGTNKRALFWLSGKSKQTPHIGDTLEMQLAENWRQTGTLLSYVMMNNSDYWIQAVLSNETTNNSTFRFFNEENALLFIRPLPYSITKQ